jgi:hypothetical protein
LRSRFEQLGAKLSVAELNCAYDLFLEAADASPNVSDAQILQIARSVAESNLKIAG